MFSKINIKRNSAINFLFAFVFIGSMSVIGYLVLNSKAATTANEFKGYYMFGEVPNASEKQNLAHPLVAGWGMAGVHWNEAQNNDGSYNWTKLDQIVNAVESTEVKNANGGKPKNVILRVIIGQAKAPIGSSQPINCSQTSDSDSFEDNIPRYVWCSGQRQNGQNRSGAKFYSWQDTDNKTGAKYQAFIPLFWDQSFKDDWGDFIKAVGQRYSGHSNVIAMVTGPYKIFGENFLPFCPTNQRSAWFQLYNRDFNKNISTNGSDSTSTLILQTEYTNFFNNYLIPLYSNSFTNYKPIAIGTGLGACDSDNTENTKIYDYAREQLGGFGNQSQNNRGWFVQFNGLGPNYNNPDNYTHKMIQWVSDNYSLRSANNARRGVIGYQTVGGTEPFCGSAQCIASSGFDQTIKNAVDLKASYVEVYNTDFKAAINYDQKNSTYNGYSAEEKAGAKVIYDTLVKYQDQLVSTISETSSSDTTAPNISIIEPSNNASVSGDISINANATDNIGVVNVVFKIDDQLVASKTSTPFNYLWDTSTASNGSHTITATAYDAAGNQKQTAVTVTVNNQATITIFPPTNLKAEAGDGQTTISWDDNTNTLPVEYVVSYKVQGFSTWIWVSSGNNKSLTQTGLTNEETYEFRVRAKYTDQQGIKTVSDDAGPILATPTAPLPPPDTVKPSVSLTSPTAGATLSGDEIVLSADASDNVGVTLVEFWLGSTKIAEKSQPPYSVTWDSSTITDGNYNLTARAYDVAGNVRISAFIAVIVDNAFILNKADLNGDSKVDIFDLSILLSKWNSSDTTSDINKDGTVNVFDLSILLGNWNG